MKKHRIHPDTHLVSALILFVVVILAFLLSYQGYLSRQRPACTEEARVCANGTTVTRSGPACEFAPCPNDNLPDKPGITEEPLQAPAPKGTTKKSGEAARCTLEVKTCSDGSFVTRTGPGCAFAPCPDDLELDTYR